jgi:hypothetical protein
MQQIELFHRIHTIKVLPKKLCFIFLKYFMHNIPSSASQYLFSLVLYFTTLFNEIQSTFFVYAKKIQILTEARFLLFFFPFIYFPRSSSYRKMCPCFHLFSIFINKKEFFFDIFSFLLFSPFHGLGEKNIFNVNSIAVISAFSSDWRHTRCFREHTKKICSTHTFKITFCKSINPRTTQNSSASNRKLLYECVCVSFVHSFLYAVLCHRIDVNFSFRKKPVFLSTSSHIFTRSRSLVVYVVERV